MYGLSHLLKKIRGTASLEIKFARFRALFANRSTLILLFAIVGQTTLAEVTGLPGVDNVEMTLSRELLVGTDFVH